MARSRSAFVLVLLSVIPAVAPAQTPLASTAPRPAAAADPPPAPREALVDVNAIDPESFHAIAVRVPQGLALKIDGHLDEEAWQLAPAQGQFIQREPRFGARSTERTEFRVLYDERRLYFGIWAYDSDAGGIRASELKRDSGLRKGDQIKINIDTFHDHRNAYYFSTNPLGAYKDAQSTENGRTINYDWNAVWENHTSVDDKGWYAEIAIPLSQLRFKGGLGQATWGLNVCRIIIRKNEETYWVPFPREWTATGFTRMSRAGVLLGLKDLPSRRRIELLPFLTPSISRDFDAGTPTRGAAGYGIDARIGITSNLTADLTYKTDFAQVEADQEVVNLSRFSLFFPEKRQFFTESGGTFSFGSTGNSKQGGDSAAEAGLLQLFYTRRIGLQDGAEIPLLGGGKVTGRAGRFTLGAMNIQTERARVRLGDGSAADIAPANFSVLRVKRDVLSQSSLGVILLNKDGQGAADNRTIGVDAGLYVGRGLGVTGLFARTFSPGKAGTDSAGAVDVQWKTDRAYVNGTYLDVGTRFNPEMGFVPRLDIRESRLKAGWTPRPRWRGVRQLTLGGQIDYFEDHAGVPDSRNQELVVSVLQHDNATYGVTLDRDFDRLPADWATAGSIIPRGEYAWNTVKLSYASDQSRRVYATAGLDAGGYYGGDRRTYRASLNFVLKDTLLVEPNYTRNDISLPGASRYVTNTLNTRVSYSFSPDLFVKGFFQYNDARKTASFNALLWYIYKPGSDFYLVYDHGWNTDAPEERYWRTRGRRLTAKVTFWLSR